MKYLPAILLSALIPLLLPAATPEQQRKSDYYYVEALVREAAEEHDVSYLLMQRAVELDSVSSTAPGSMLGARMMTISRGDTAMFRSGLNLLERHFRANPSDLYAGMNLALGYERYGLTDRVLEIWATLDSMNADNSSVVWRRATMEARYGSPEKTLELMNRIEKLDGPNPQMAMNQARVMLDMGDTIAATARIDRMLSEMPSDAIARVYASTFYEVIGQQDRADDYIEAALALDPSNGTAYYQRARRYKDTGRNAEYFNEIAGAVDLDDLDRESKIALVADYIGEYADSLNRRDEIEGLLGRLLTQFSHDEELRRYAGGYYAGIGDYARAAEQLSYVADMNHDDPSVWGAMVRLYATADSLTRSIEVAREAVGYMPDDVSLRQLLGMVLTENGQYSEAVETLREAISMNEADDPDVCSELYTTMGDVFQKLEMPDSAIVAYEKALVLDPDNDLALNNYAYFLSELNRELARAEQMSSKSMLLRPGQATYLDTYAWIQFKLGNYQQAKEYIDTALLRSGDDLSAELLEHAGDISYMVGRHEQALSYWEEALELEADNNRLKQKLETGKIE